MTPDRPANQRRSPKQARAKATWEAIVEAAAQILERGGPSALNTNAVAERAGVSIGTLYQYFADKQSILLAAAEREARRNEPGLAARSRALLQAVMDLLASLGQATAAAGGGQTNARSRTRPSKDEAAGLLSVIWRALPAAAPMLVYAR